MNRMTTHYARGRVPSLAQGTAQALALAPAFALAPALALALAVATAVPAHAAFKDPLDKPAVASPLAVKRQINALAMAGRRVVAVGQRGHILYSDDGGKSWSQAAVPVSVDLNAVVFPSALVGWAVGHSGVVLATRDGGASWTRQLDGRAVGKLLVAYYGGAGPAGVDPAALVQLQQDSQRFADEGPDKPFLDVWFENERSGYIVGSFNLILKTGDGGASWRPLLERTDNPKQLHFNAVRAVGGELYVVGEQGLVLRLDQATQRFRAVPTSYQGSFFGVTGKPGAVLVYGLRGNAYRSADGGANWSKVDTGVTAALTGATVTADGRVLLVSQRGQVLAASADGAGMVEQKQERRVPAAALLELAGGVRIIAGARGIDSQAVRSTP
jgi:photosystem II stability/assembly factor-like uncharacterized protein